MMMEKLVEWWLAGETEVLGENLPQCRFVHHKTHMPAWTQTWSAALGSQRLTAWDTARLLVQATEIKLKMEGGRTGKVWNYTFYLFIYNLINNVISSSDTTAPNYETVLNTELERMWRKQLRPISRYCPGICLVGGLRKTMTNLSHDSQVSWLRFELGTS
jgi:hypothetical protein